MTWRVAWRRHLPVEGDPADDCLRNPAGCRTDRSTASYSAGIPRTPPGPHGTTLLDGGHGINLVGALASVIVTVLLAIVARGICTVIYVCVAAVMTGVVPYKQLGIADPLAIAVDAVHQPPIG